MSSSRTSRRRSSGNSSLATPAAKRGEGLKSPASGQLTHGFIKEVSPSRSAAKQPGHSKNSSTGSRRHSHQSPSVTERSGNLNRWSQSTASSIITTAGSNREKSYIKRLSLGSPFQGTSNVLRRSPSPRKMASNAGQTYEASPANDLTNMVQQAPQLPSRPAPLAPNFSDVTPEPMALWNRQISTAGNSTSAKSSEAPLGSNFGDDYTNMNRVPHTVGGDLNSSQVGPDSQTGQSEPLDPILHQRAGASPNKSRRTRSSREDDHSTQSPRRVRSKQEKEKKIMLSRALKQAQAAVELDNSQDYEGAIEAYNFACALLGQVLEKSSSEDDRRKLSQIRVTYELRIQELEFLERHQSIDTNGWHEETASQVVFQPVKSTPSKMAERENAKLMSPGRDAIESGAKTKLLESQPRIELPTKPQTSKMSSKPTPLMLGSDGADRNNPPTNDGAMPPPLTPRRLPSLESPTTANHGDFKNGMERTLISQDGQTIEVPARTVSRGLPNSWLDGSTETPEVTKPSMGESEFTHFRSSSGATEAEFDAALDAAVEAAYDGYDPYDDNNTTYLRASSSASNTPVPRFTNSSSLDVDDVPTTKAAEGQYIQPGAHQVQTSQFDDELDPSADEEERMLEEMTKEYLPDSLMFGSASKTSLPRQSDSSSFSGRTWKSSTASSGMTAATSLSTVGENMIVPASLSLPASSRNSNSPSAGSVPFPPPLAKIPPPILPPPHLSIPTLSLPQSPSVRDRRLSGAKRLKIETAPAPSTSRPQTRDRSLSPPKSQGALASAIAKPSPRTQNSTHLSNDSTQSGSSWHGNTHTSYSVPRQQSTESTGSNVLLDGTALPLVSGGSQESNSRHSPQSSSPHRAFGKMSGDRGLLKKNASSLSLKGTASPGSESTVQPSTPMDFGFSTLTTTTSNRQILQHGNTNTPLTTPLSSSFSRVSKTPLTTPVRSTFSPMGDEHLFDGDFHEPQTPGSPNPLAVNGPSPLEPCPTSFLLRPFWLMRCLYQTIANPRGGYMSTRLFVPRGVWMVQNVKLKAIDDKISNCDLLTAALLKLGAVDTLDADAVLEEMQMLENVLDQVRTNLSKKLGNDVGMQGLSTLFKDGGIASTDSSQASDSSTITSNSSKSSTGKFSSWRRLRSKSSGVGLTQSHVNSREQQLKDPPLMSTVPMTSSPSLRSPKPEFTNPQCVGPNANYMNALVRLFDAVQVVDRIVRQVEDPGLRHTSKTHVGLELGARHAAEFFAFFICRFVVSDVTLLLEKFIKRASEWVMV